MSKPTLKIARTIRSEQALDAFVEVVRKNVPLDLRNTRITAEDILGVLEYAHVHRLSVESACRELQQAPSGNRLREVLTESLPDRAVLQRRLNRIFRQQIHPSIWTCKLDFNVAIDMTLIPYHGQPYADQKEIVPSAPKSGTTHFQGYATISIVRDNRRYVVVMRFIEYGEEMAAIVPLAAQTPEFDSLSHPSGVFGQRFPFQASFQDSEATQTELSHAKSSCRLPCHRRPQTLLVLEQPDFERSPKSNSASVFLHSHSGSRLHD